MAAREHVQSPSSIVRQRQQNKSRREAAAVSSVVMQLGVNLPTHLSCLLYAAITSTTPAPAIFHASYTFYMNHVV